MKFSLVVALSLPLLACTTVSLTGCDENEPEREPELRLLGSYATNIFDDSAAEIVAHDSTGQRLFVVNGADEAIDILDISAPATPAKTGSLSLATVATDAGGPNSVAIHGDLLAVALANDDKQANGYVALYTLSDLKLARLFNAGALPDMVTFSPDGNWLLAANEGEPDGSNDPEGSVTVIDLRNGITAATTATAGFTSFNSQLSALTAAGVRIYGPDEGNAPTVAKDLEPEYIAVNADSTRAWVSLQENNAIAIVDIATATVESIKPLGFKDHSAAGNEFDASDRDDAISIQSWPTLGMYQPDSIAWYQAGGADYIVTANEGDARGFEEQRINDLELDATAFPNAAALQANDQLGRLEITNMLGDTDGDGDFDRLYSYGARSFSIFRADDLSLVYDSGSDFETITAERIPNAFNSSNDSNDDFDSRSDAKGPEPEALAIGNIDGRNYAFIGLERVGGIMVYDITSPTAVRFIEYRLDRDFTADAESAAAGNLGPEGISFIPAGKSPNGLNMLAVANEVSGTTTLYAIDSVVVK